MNTLARNFYDNGYNEKDVQRVIDDLPPCCRANVQLKMDDTVSDTFMRRLKAEMLTDARYTAEHH